GRPEQDHGECDRHAHATGGCPPPRASYFAKPRESAYTSPGVAMTTAWRRDTKCSSAFRPSHAATATSTLNSEAWTPGREKNCANPFTLNLLVLAWVGRGRRCERVPP